MNIPLGLFLLLVGYYLSKIAWNKDETESPFEFIVLVFTAGGVYLAAIFTIFGWW